jgi:hypothetical protein
MTKIESICRKFENGVGFSNGCALLALKKPPPLVPSILIASCEATGPCAIVCVWFGCSSGCAVVYALQILRHTPEPPATAHK